MDSTGVPFYLMFIPQLLALLGAFICTLRTYYSFPTKRWRFLAIFVWLSLATIGQVAAIIIFLLPLGTLETFRITHWIDKTLSLIGYLSVIVTMILIGNFYRRLGYGK